MRIIKKTITKNNITAFCNDKFVKNFILITMNNKKKYLNQCL